MIAALIYAWYGWITIIAMAIGLGLLIKWLWPL